MEVEEIRTKFSTRIDSTKISQKGDGNYPDEEEDGEAKNRNKRGGGGEFVSGVGRLCGWPTSRIISVARASGGKDRHSKVWTSKGLRDRRVRLSVSTAIQFYDLQDRLGYDQPSKAVEWLLKAAASSISELPSINTSFPDTPKQLSDEKRWSSADTDHQQGFHSAEIEFDGGDPNFQQQQLVSPPMSKSACSSTSETSKGSGFSLSRSESRIKARERARERAAEKEKEKEKENESRITHHHQQNVNPISQTSSFTELLTSGINRNFSNNNVNTSAHQNPVGSSGGEGNLFHKSSRSQWSSTPMDYFAPVLIGSSSSSRTTHNYSPSGQIHMGNSLPHSMVVSSPFNVTGDHHNHHQEQQHFSFVPEYNLSFAISSGLAGYSRGTLQSNSPSMLPHLQRFSPIDGSNSNVPFFIGTMAPNAVPVENHRQHQFSPGLFDGRLQLNSDPKGKGKN